MVEHRSADPNCQRVDGNPVNLCVAKESNKRLTETGVSTKLILRIEINRVRHVERAMTRKEYSMTLQDSTGTSSAAPPAPERSPEARSQESSRKAALGSPVPRMNPVVLVRGRLMPRGVSSLSHGWVALCFPGSLHSGIVSSVNRQAEVLAREGVAMVVVLTDARLFRLSQRQDLSHITAPILTDPLRRLHRWYGVHRHSPFSDLTTFLVDPDRILRFAFDMALDGRDCEILRNALRTTSNTSGGYQGSTRRKEGSHVLCSCS